MRKTKEQKEWLIKNRNNYENFNHLTEAFNHQFKTNIKMSSIYNFLRCRGYIDKKNESYCLSKAEIDYLRENIIIMPYRELTESFNEVFDKKYSIRRIQHICFNNGIYRGGKGLPLGTEREVCGGKYIIVKIKQKGSKNECWQLKQRKIYEETFGKIPNGKVIFFLDGNTHNYSLDNLYLTEKRVVYLLRNSRWITNDVDLNLTMLKWCELYYALKQTNQKANS